MKLYTTNIYHFNPNFSGLTQHDLLQCKCNCWSDRLR